MIGIVQKKKVNTGQKLEEGGARRLGKTSLKRVLHNDRNEAVPRRRGSEHVETWKGVQAERGCKHQALRLRACLVSLKPLWLEGGEWESEP